MRDQPVIMSGSLGEWSIEDLLQIARITHKTTCIEVQGPQASGAIFLRNGAVIDAFVDQAPRGGGSRFSQVVEAIEVLGSVEDGHFEFTARSAPDVDDRPIEVPAITAAMEKDTLREKRLTDLGIDGREGLAIGRHIDGAMNLKPAVWQLLADLVDPFSLETLQDRMGRRKAVATLLTLDALGVLERSDASVSARVSSEPNVAEPDEPHIPEQVRVDDDESVDVLFEPSVVEESGAEEPPPPLLPDDQNPWMTDATPTASESPGTDADPDEPIVEIFEPIGDQPAGPPAEMHEVVTPSETTLVSDVLGDMRSRFREREYLYEDDED